MVFITQSSVPKHQHHQQAPCNTVVSARPFPQGDSSHRQALKAPRQTPAAIGSMPACPPPTAASTPMHVCTHTLHSQALGVPQASTSTRMPHTPHPTTLCCCTPCYKRLPGACMSPHDVYVFHLSVPVDAGASSGGRCGYKGALPPATTQHALLKQVQHCRIQCCPTAAGQEHQAQRLKSTGAEACPG